MAPEMNLNGCLSQKIIFTLTWVFLWVSSVSVFGQQPDTEEPVQKITLDEVIISANKVEEPVRKVSQAIKTLNSKAIKEIAAATTAELISMGAGLNVQKSQQGGGSPNLRGFESNRILLVVDGVRMNNLIYRGGHLQNIITLDPAILEKVEILFGPSSTVYGSDALGGTIHLITKDPILANNNSGPVYKTNAFTRYALANNGITSHIDFNFGRQKFGSLSSVTYSHLGDLRMGNNKNPFYDENFGERNYYMKRFGTLDSMVHNSDPLVQKYSGYEQLDLLQKFIIRPSERIQHRFNLQFSTSGNIPRYDRLTEMSGDKLKYAQWYYGPQARFLSAYDLNLKPRAGFDRIHVNLSAQYVEESRHSRKTNQDFLTHRHEYVNLISGDIDLQKTWAQHDLRLGTEFQLNTLNSTACDENVITGTNKKVTSRYPDGRNNMNFFDIYISHRLDMTDKLSYSQALRFGYTSLHSSFSDMELFPFPFKTMTQECPTFSGSIGFTYLPATWKLSLHLSTGYRVPNIDDLAKIFERPNNAIVVPNANIKPENTYNADFGISKSWRPGLHWNFNLYGTYFNEIIVVSPSTYNGQDSILFEGELCQVLSGQNKDHAFLCGFSSTLSGEISPGFSLDGGIYYTYGRIHEEGGIKPMNSIAPLSAKAGASYRYHSLSSSVFILFNGWKPMKDYYLDSEDNEQYATSKGMPAWFTLNIRVDYKVNKYLSIQLGIDNILDIQYRVFASGINAPGRNIIGTAKISL
jgi:hemoglobin/transferrin/lactoferrin receptor protein